jgi:hypothetical protein
MSIRTFFLSTIFLPKKNILEKNGELVKKTVLHSFIGAEFVKL